MFDVHKMPACRIVREYTGNPGDYVVVTGDKDHDDWRSFVTSEQTVVARTADRVYKVKNVLATTDRSELKLACELSTQRNVVIKSSNTNFSLSSNEDPRRESSILRKLNGNKFGFSHPHIVGLLDSAVDIEKGCIYLMFEYCSGGDLFTRVKDGRLSEQVARTFFQELVSAVAFLHKHNVTHLDISLENILLDSEQQHIKLCDFGVAQELQSPSHKLQGKVGKLGCMAPEVYSGVPFDGRQADIWSCGIVLFVMLTSVPPLICPHSSDTCFDLIRKRGIQELCKVWKFTEIISDCCQDLLAGMIAPPSRRLSIEQVQNHPWLTSKISLE